MKGGFFMAKTQKITRSELVILVVVTCLFALLICLLAMLMNYVINDQLMAYDVGISTQKQNDFVSETSKTKSETINEVIMVATCNRNFTIVSENNKIYNFFIAQQVNIVDFNIKEDIYIILMDNGDIVKIPYNYVE